MPKQRARVSLLGFTNTSAVAQLEHPVQINNFLRKAIIPMRTNLQHTATNVRQGEAQYMRKAGGFRGEGEGEGIVVHCCADDVRTNTPRY